MDEAYGPSHLVPEEDDNYYGPGQLMLEEDDDHGGQGEGPHLNNSFSSDGPSGAEEDTSDCGAYDAGPAETHTQNALISAQAHWPGNYVDEDPLVEGGGYALTTANHNSVQETQQSLFVLTPANHNSVQETQQPLVQGVIPRGATAPVRGTPPGKTRLTVPQPGRQLTKLTKRGRRRKFGPPPCNRSQRERWGPQREQAIQMCIIVGPAVEQGVTETPPAVGQRDNRPLPRKPSANHFNYNATAQYSRNSHYSCSKEFRLASLLFPFAL